MNDEFSLEGDMFEIFLFEFMRMYYMYVLIL